jgi:hypothetical protein
MKLASLQMNKLTKKAKAAAEHRWTPIQNNDAYQLHPRPEICSGY